MIRPISSQKFCEQMQWRHIGNEVLLDKIVIDSRIVQPKDCYVALMGANNDGHDYVLDVSQQGASAALLNHPVEGDITQLICEDTLQGLAELGKYNRANYKGSVVAITGSAGKTTAKELVAAICEEMGATDRTQGNFNNEVGVPLTLLALSESSKFSVVEMGAAQIGDIAYLVDLADPDVVLITNVGNAHVGRFGSVENIFTAKSELFNSARADAIRVINLDDSYADQWIEANKQYRSITFSRTREADVCAKNIELNLDSVSFDLHFGSEQIAVELAIPGLHSVSNALAAAAVTVSLGADLAAIKKAFQGFRAVAGRSSTLIGLRDCIVIDESYNANPIAMNAALQALSLHGGEKIAVLGDMAELGDDAAEFHCQVGEHAAKLGVDQLYVVGQYAQNYAAGFGESSAVFSDKKSLLQKLKNSVTSNSRVLIKGSRSAGMEEVVQGLANKNNNKLEALC